MAQFPLKDFIDGTKQLATRLYGPNGEVISELNPMPVTLSGRDTAFEIVLPREIRTKDTAFFRPSVPGWARGCSIQLRVFGITGTFETGQGVQLECNPNVWSSGLYLGGSSTRTSRLTVQADHAIWIYPGASAGDMTIINDAVKIIALPIQRFTFILRISGTFEPGQGIDREVAVVWFP